MKSPTAPWVGQRLTGGRYEVTRKLGEGGMGFVYLAKDGNLNQQVVIKVPRPSMLEDPEFAGRFAREIRSLVELAHPRIVPILDVGEHNGVPFAVMKYLPGGSLNDRRPKRRDGFLGPLPADQVGTWLGPVAEGLDFVHQQGFVHRDVKPDNILFDAHGNPYLGDFGVAKAVYDQTPNRKRAQTVQTQTGMVLGTPQYMAPEMILGEKFDGRVDQYALAVAVYEVLSARFPFDGPTGAAILLKQTQQAPPPLDSLVPGLPSRIAAAIHQALDKDPARRFPSCSAFTAALLTGKGTARAVRPTGPMGTQKIAPVVPTPMGMRPATLIEAAPAAPTRQERGVAPATRQERAVATTREPIVRPRRRKTAFILVGVLLAAVAGGFFVVISLIGKKAAITQQVAQATSAAAPTEAVVVPTNPLPKSPVETRSDPKKDPTKKEPVEPKKEPQRPLAITALPPSVTLTAGEESKLDIGFDSGGRSGPPRVEFKNGPPGLVVKDVKDNGTDPKITVTLSVPASAAEVSKPSRIHLALGVPEQTTEKDLLIVVKRRPAKLVLLAVPTEEEISRSLTPIRKEHASAYAKRDTASKRTLAATLLDQGRKTKSDATARFGLFRESRDFAMSAGDFVGGVDAAEALAKEFDVNGLEMKATVLEKTVTTVQSGSAARKFVPLALDLFWQAIVHDNTSQAAQFLSQARQVALQNDDLALGASTLFAGEALILMQAAAAQLRLVDDALERNPKDPAANLARGKFLCLVKGDWDKGLPLLTRGSTSSLTELAKRDLAVPPTADAQGALGDGWWELADSLTDLTTDSGRQQLRQRARHWYQKAVAGLNGVARERVESRLQTTGLPKLVPTTFKRPAEVLALRGHTGVILSVSVSADGRRALSAGEDKVLRLWDLDTGKALHQLKGHEDAIYGVAISPDGKRGITASIDKSVGLWDLETGNKRWFAFHGKTEVQCVAVAPDGKSGLSGGADKLARLWDLKSGKEAFAFTGHKREVVSVAFSRDGQRVLTGSWDNQVKLWDANTGKEVLQCSGHSSKVVSVAMSPDGTRALSAGEDSTVRGWDLATGKELYRLNGHTGNVAAVAIAPDGRRALTAGVGKEDRTARLWDLETGKELVRFDGHKAPVEAVAFLPDGRRALSAGDDHTVRLWEWKPVVRPEDVPAVVLALEDAQESVRRLAAAVLKGDNGHGDMLKILANTPTRARTAVPLLMASLKSDLAAVRLQAVTILAGLGADAEPARTRLTEVAEKDPDASVRQEAKNALEKMGGK